MKFTFETKELQYIDLIVNILLMSKLTPKEAMPVLKKMQYKFRASAKLVFLNGKERTFLSGVLSHRQNDLVKVHSVTEEVNVIQAVLNKIGV